MTAFPLTVAVTPNAVQVKPGGTAQISVDVTNVSDIVQHYQVTIVGLPSDDYWASEPAVTKLRPGESGTIGVRINLPEKGGVLGGRTDLGVLVTSPYQPDVSRSVDLALDVSAVAGIELTATPMTATDRTSAAYAVSLSNEGNLEVPVDLVASDDHGKAQIVISPPSLDIRPGESQAAQVSVRARGILTGQERRSTISIKAQAGNETRGDVSVTFIQTPWISPGVLRVLGIALGVMILAGSMVAGAVIGVQKRQSASDTPATTQARADHGEPSDIARRGSHCLDVAAHVKPSHFARRGSHCLDVAAHVKPSHIARRGSHCLDVAAHVKPSHIAHRGKALLRRRRPNRPCPRSPSIRRCP